MTDPGTVPTPAPIYEAYNRACDRHGLVAGELYLLHALLNFGAAPFNRELSPPLLKVLSRSKGEKR